MKRILSGILLLVYFTVSTGFVVSFHYCMDELDSVQFGNGDEKCGKCGMHNDGGCCRDEVKVLKLDTEQLVSKAFTASFTPSAPPIQTSLVLDQLVQQKDLPSGYISHPPPLLLQPIYLQVCVFRI
jgi:hypothetical protein